MEQIGIFQLEGKLVRFLAIGDAVRRHFLTFSSRCQDAMAYQFRS